MSAQILNFKNYLPLLKPRDRLSNKGHFGHVLLIGGAPGYAGAVRLAGEAALRSGAGLVSVATHPIHAPFLQATRPELICHGVSEAQELTVLLQRASVIGIGPGLGQGPWGQMLLSETLKIANKPIIFDADALNLLPKARYQPLLSHIYTPHPGEAGKLLNLTAQEVQIDRMLALNKLMQQYPGIVVLKGAHTLIGQQQQPTYQCNAGNPGMATAGMGDVLTGVISGLVAQHLPLFDAACLGVLVHALAGDSVAEQKGERGLIASDLFASIQNLLNPSE